jgi:hypothetical protein
MGSRSTRTFSQVEPSHSVCELRFSPVSWLNSRLIPLLRYGFEGRIVSPSSEVFDVGAAVVLAFFRGLNPAAKTSSEFIAHSGTSFHAITFVSLVTRLAAYG